MGIDAQSGRASGLNAADLENQIHIVEVRREGITKELEFQRRKLSECLKKLKGMRRRASEGERIEPERLYYWEREEFDTKAKIADLQTEMGKTRVALGRLNGLLNARRIESARAACSTRSEADLLFALGKLRDKYEGFASDHTRVNSKRLMAAEFAKELTAMMRQVGMALDI